jgi:hypothetical protein
MYRHSVRRRPCACLSCVLNGKDAPDASQRPAQRGLVIEIALYDVDALACQCRRLLAVRLARQTAQIESGSLQRVRDPPPCLPITPVMRIVRLLVMAETSFLVPDVLH